MTDQQHAIVLGGAGFLGSHLCDKLLDMGMRVTAIDNFVTGRPRNVAHLAARADFALIEADATDLPPIEGDVDFIFQFASPASPPDYLEHPIETLRVGSVGTLNSLELAKEKGARFVIASTSEIYGDPLVNPQPESYWGNVNSIGPRSVYDEAKRFSEAATAAYRRHHGVDTAIVRIFNTYGPRMRPDDGRAVPNFIMAALADEPLPIHGEGSQTRSLCYVDDLIAGILALTFSGHPGPMNIGNPNEMTVKELAQAIIDSIGAKSSFEYHPRPEDDPNVRRPDITLAKTELGWQPEVDLADGLKLTVEYFRDLNRT